MLQVNEIMQNLKIGKLYKVLKPIDIIPLECFEDYKFDYHHKVITICDDSKPSIFLFVENVIDKNNIKFSKILYKNKVYITYGTYHLNDKVKIL